MPPNGIELSRTRGLAKSTIQDNLPAGARVRKETWAPHRHHEPHDGVVIHETYSLLIAGRRSRVSYFQPPITASLYSSQKTVTS